MSNFASGFFTVQIRKDAAEWARLSVYPALDGTQTFDELIESCFPASGKYLVKVQVSFEILARNVEELEVVEVEEELDAA
jgi:hypothetical protein